MNLLVFCLQHQIIDKSIRPVITVYDNEEESAERAIFPPFRAITRLVCGLPHEKRSRLERRSRSAVHYRKRLGSKRTPDKLAAYTQSLLAAAITAVLTRGKVSGDREDAMRPRSRTAQIHTAAARSIQELESDGIRELYGQVARL